jgi:hypothetical protein
MKKNIEICYYKPSELFLSFGNPRKISETNKEKLKQKIQQFGDHDIIKINDKLQVISGNQRIQAMIALNIDIPILCKKLIGYTEKELKKINLDSNEHEGEWDYDLLNEWKIELQDFDFDIPVIDDQDYLTTTQKQKYLQDNMMIKIGNLEFFIKQNNQPINFKCFFKNELTEAIKNIIISGIENIADEICNMV